MNFLFTPLPYFLAVWLLLAGWTFAGNGDFQIQSVRKTTDQGWICVDGKWMMDCPERILVNVRVNSDIPSRNVFLKAYFYDRIGSLIKTYNKPHELWIKTKEGMKGVAFPEVLEKGQRYEMYFGIPKDLDKEKPKSFLFAFGNKDSVDVKMRPDSNNPEEFEFEEKAIRRKTFTGGDE